MSRYPQRLQLLKDNILWYARIPKKQQNIQNTPLKILQPRMQKRFSKDLRLINIPWLLQKHADCPPLHSWNHLLRCIRKRFTANIWLNADIMETIWCDKRYPVWWGSSWKITYLEINLHWLTCRQCSLYNLCWWLYHFRLRSQDSNCWYSWHFTINQLSLQK